MNIANHQKKEPDATLIKQLGGPAKLAKALGWTQAGAIQRVANWQWRGIPATVKLQRPDLFLPHLKPRRKAATTSEA